MNDVLVPEPQLISPLDAVSSTSPTNDQREQLTRVYQSREQFAYDARRLTEDGWMRGKVVERPARQSPIIRMLRRSETQFEVTYERLVRRALPEASCASQRGSGSG